MPQKAMPQSFLLSLLITKIQQSQFPYLLFSCFHIFLVFNNKDMVYAYIDMEYLINLIFVPLLFAPNNFAISEYYIWKGGEETFNIHKSTLIVITHPFTIPKTLWYLSHSLATAHNTDVICR